MHIASFRSTPIYRCFVEHISFFVQICNSFFPGFAPWTIFFILLIFHFMFIMGITDLHKISVMCLSTRGWGEGGSSGIFLCGVMCPSIICGLKNYLYFCCVNCMHSMQHNTQDSRTLPFIWLVWLSVRQTIIRRFAGMVMKFLAILINTNPALCNHF